MLNLGSIFDAEYTMLSFSQGASLAKSLCNYLLSIHHFEILGIEDLGNHYRTQVDLTLETFALLD